MAVLERLGPQTTIVHSFPPPPSRGTRSVNQAARIDNSTAAHLSRSLITGLRASGSGRNKTGGPAAPPSGPPAWGTALLPVPPLVRHEPSPTGLLASKSRRLPLDLMSRDGTVDNR